QRLTHRLDGAPRLGQLPGLELQADAGQGDGVAESPAARGRGVEPGIAAHVVALLLGGVGGAEVVQKWSLAVRRPQREFALGVGEITLDEPRVAGKDVAPGPFAVMAPLPRGEVSARVQ